MSVQVPDPVAATQAALAGADDPESAGMLTLPTLEDAQTAVGEVAGAVRDVAIGAQRTWQETWNAPWAFVQNTGAGAASGVQTAVTDGIRTFIAANVFAVVLAGVVVGGALAVAYNPPRVLKKWL